MANNRGALEVKIIQLINELKIAAAKNTPFSQENALLLQKCLAIQPQALSSHRIELEELEKALDGLDQFPRKLQRVANHVNNLEKFVNATVEKLEAKKFDATEIKDALNNLYAELNIAVELDPEFFKKEQPLIEQIQQLIQQKNTHEIILKMDLFKQLQEVVADQPLPSSLTVSPPDLKGEEGENIQRLKQLIKQINLQLCQKPPDPLTDQIDSHTHSIRLTFLDKFTQDDFRGIAKIINEFYNRFKTTTLGQYIENLIFQKVILLQQYHKIRSRLGPLTHQIFLLEASQSEAQLGWKEWIAFKRGKNPKKKLARNPGKLTCELSKMRFLERMEFEDKIYKLDQQLNFRRDLIHINELKERYSDLTLQSRQVALHQALNETQRAYFAELKSINPDKTVTQHQETLELTTQLKKQLTLSELEKVNKFDLRIFETQGNDITTFNKAQVLAAFASSELFHELVVLIGDQQLNPEALVAYATDIHDLQHEVNSLRLHTVIKTLADEKNSDAINNTINNWYEQLNRLTIGQYILRKAAIQSNITHFHKNKEILRELEMLRDKMDPLTGIAIDHLEKGHLKRMSFTEILSRFLPNDMFDSFLSDLKDCLVTKTHPLGTKHPM